MRLSTTLGAALSLSLSLALLGPAMAQTEPTIDQIYQAANAGRLADADRMIDQVLRQHPNSAKAHFVKAELAARESNAAVARDELAAAEKIAPGLPFAKPEAVQSLRKEVNGSRRLQAATTSHDDRVAPTPVAAPARQIPMGTIAIVFALVAGGFYWFVRRRSQSMAAGPAGPLVAAGPAYGPAPMDGVPPGYGPVYGAGGYPQPAQPGMGSTLGRGLATGLAVGAGVVAAEEIGRRLFDHHGQPASLQTGALPENERGLLDPGVNADMGGQDFGINDPGSWDSGGSSDVGGGDWDS